MMKSDSICFDIIMPCYNSAAYVRDAVNSLLAQEYPRWHLIAVNDGSKDDTLSILEEYARRDSRISVYSKENGGYCSAINYGLDRVRGDYFLMMGSDDCLVSSLFEQIAGEMGDVPYDMVGFRAVKIKDGALREIDDESNFQTIVREKGVLIKEFEKRYPEHSRIFLVRDTAKCYKTELLGDLRYFGRYGFDADGIFSALFAHRARSFLNLPIDGYLWTIRDDSLSAKTDLRINCDRIDDWNLYLEHLQNANLDEITNREKNYLHEVYHLICGVLREKDELSDLQIEKTLYTKRLLLCVAKKLGIDKAVRIYGFKSVVAQRCPWLVRMKQTLKRK